MSTHDAVATVGVRQPLAIVQAPTIKPEPGEVRVQILWTASTPLDLHQNDGGLMVTHPQVLGGEIAGRVVEVGPDVKSLKIGDEVFGFAWRSPKEKAYQTYATVPTYLLGKKPHNVSFEEAVTVPGNFITAWNSLVTYLDIELPYPKPEDYQPSNPSQAILIWGGTTSVGQYTLQILKHYGYKRVAVAASKKHHKYLVNLGATFTADYNDGDIIQQIKGYFGAGPIRALDCVGSVKGSIGPISQIATESSSVVGILVPVVVQQATEEAAPEYSMDVESAATWEGGVVVRGVLTFLYLDNSWSKENLQSIVMVDLLERGIIQPNRYRIIEGKTLLERAQNALDILRSGKVSGERLVWKVSEN